MRPQTNTNLIIPNRNGVVPVTTTPGWRSWNLVDIVNKDIDSSSFFANLLKQACNVIVITMITLDGVTFAASFSDLTCCCIDRSFTLTDSSARCVYRTALFR
jgi:hypothetical protein